MNAPILLILLPMAGALVALTGKLLPAGGRAERAVRAVAIVPSAAAAWVLATTFPIVQGGAITYALGGFPVGIGIPLVLDGLAWVTSALIALVTVVVALASLPHSSFDSSYFFFLLMTSAGMQSVVLTGDLFTMFVSFEIVAIGAYVLIAWERSAQGLLAGLKYLFLSSVGILFFLFGVFLVYRDLGTLSFAGVAQAVAEATGTAGTGLGASGPLPAAGPSRSLPLAVAALCVGIGVRTAFIPFHTWLPEAHAWAPHPVSALLSGVLIKVSFFAMIRIIGVFGATYLHPLLLWIGAVTALTAVVWALAQHDAKRLLAFHSISQMGYILAAWGAASSLSVPAAFSHAINHALFKSLLFLSVGIAIKRIGSRDIYRMRGAARGAPLIAIGLVVGSLAIAGVPPFNGYVSKQLVSAALYGSPAYPLLWLASVGTAASFIKLSRIAWPGGGSLEPTGTADVGAGTAAPTTPVGGGALPVRSNHGSKHHTPTAAAERLRRLPEGFALGLLIVLVIAGGVVGGPAVRALWSTVEHSSVADITGSGGLPNLFAPDRLRSSIAPIVLGAPLALLVMRPRVRRVSHRFAAYAPQLRTVLVLFVVGLVLFAVAPIL